MEINRTIDENLTMIENTKEAIRQAIIEKGVEVSVDVPLDEYAAKILELK